MRFGTSLNDTARDEAFRAQEKNSGVTDEGSFGNNPLLQLARLGSTLEEFTVA